MSSSERRAVVADDEDSIVFLVSSLLRFEGWNEVIEAADGDEAASASLGPEPLGLLCIDLTMPGRNSLELVREVRAQKPDATILVLSGRPDDAAAALAAGATAFVPKPFSTAEFRRLARTVAAPA